MTDGITSLSNGRVRERESVTGPSLRSRGPRAQRHRQGQAVQARRPAGPIIRSIDVYGLGLGSPTRSTLVGLR